MESTHDQKQQRAIRMGEMADEFLQVAQTQIKSDGILQAPEIVAIFAFACAKAIVSYSENPALATDLAGTALRIIIKNLKTHGVTIPDLGMEHWIPPNLHSGTTSQH